MNAWRWSISLAASALFIAGCAPNRHDGQPRVICHNSNCIEPANPLEDDTPDALEASLALVDDSDTPLIDGVEVDTFWYGAEDTCLFAHDLIHLENTSPIDTARQIIEDHLRTRHAASKALTRSGEPFSIYIELKGHVGESKAEKHSAAQRTSHAACAANLGDALAAAATDAGFSIEVVYTSFDAQLLVDLSKSPELAQLRSSTAATVKLGYLVGVPAPLDSQSKPFDSFPEDLEIDVLSAHPHWTRHPTLEAAEANGWDLSLWMFSAVPETYDAISQYRPQYITTSEARALTGWLDNQSF